MIEIALKEELKDFFQERNKHVNLVELTSESFVESDVIVTTPEGVSYNQISGSKLRDKNFLVHLMLQPENKSKNEDKSDYTSNLTEVVPPAIKILSGSILPKKLGSYDGTWSWWIDQIQAIDLLTLTHDESFAGRFFKSEKENLFHKICFISNEEAKKAHKKGDIEKVDPYEFDIISDAQKEFIDLLGNLDHKLQRFKSLIPTCMSRLNTKVDSLIKDIEINQFSEVELRKNIFITGFFSAGKTTLINQLFLKNQLNLSTNEKANTATIFNIEFSRIGGGIENKFKFNKINRHKIIAPLKENQVHLSHKESYNQVRERRDGLKDGKHYFYYCPLGQLYALEKFVLKTNRWKENSLGLEVDWEFVVELGENNNVVIKKFENKNNLISYLKKFRCDEHLKSGDLRYFQCFEAQNNSNDQEVVLRKVFLNLRASLPGAGKKNNHDSTVLSFDITELEKLKEKFEDNLVPWIKTEINISLPLSQDFGWAQNIELVDTPGIGSPNVGHDQVTLHRLNHLGATDVVFNVLPCLGTLESLEGGGVEYLLKILPHIKNRRHVVIINSKGELTEENRKNIESSLRKKLKNKLKQSDNNEDLIRLLDHMEIIAINLLDPEAQVRKKFEDKIGDIFDNFLEDNCDILLRRLKNFSRPLEDEFKKVKDKQKIQQKMNRLEDLVDKLNNTQKNKFSYKLGEKLKKKEIKFFESANKRFKDLKNLNPSSDSVDRLNKAFRMVLDENKLNKSSPTISQPVWYLFQNKDHFEKAHEICEKAVEHLLKKDIGVTGAINEEVYKIFETQDKKRWIPYLEKRNTYLNKIIDIKNEFQGIIDELSEFVEEYEDGGLLKKGFKKILNVIKKVCPGAQSARDVWRERLEDMREICLDRSKFLGKQIEDWARHITKHCYKGCLPIWKKDIENLRSDKSLQEIQNFDLQEARNRVDKMKDMLNSFQEGENNNE